MIESNFCGLKERDFSLDLFSELSRMVEDEALIPNAPEDVLLFSSIVGNKKGWSSLGQWSSTPPANLLSAVTLLSVPLKFLKAWKTEVRISVALD